MIVFEGLNMIICKIYLDIINGSEYIVTELAQKNIPEGIANVEDGDEELKEVKISSPEYVAISKEAIDALDRMNNDPHLNKISLDSDFAWKIDSFNKKPSFSYIPYPEKNDSLRKKVVQVSSCLYINPYENSYYSVSSKMKLCDNEFLKNLDLVEPWRD